MARRTRAEAEATAAEIVRVARRRFAEQGFPAVSVDDIAAEAGVTRGAVYHHFASKGGVFAAAVAQAQAELADRVSEAADAAARSADPVDGLVAGCRAWLEGALAPDTLQLLLVDGPAVLGWQQWRTGDGAGAARLLAQGLAALAEQGRLRTDAPAALAALLSGAMNEAALHAAAQPDRDAALEAVWAELSRVLEGLRTQPRRP